MRLTAHFGTRSSIFSSVSAAEVSIRAASRLERIIEPNDPRSSRAARDVATSVVTSAAFMFSKTSFAAAASSPAISAAHKAAAAFPAVSRVHTK